MISRLRGLLIAKQTPFLSIEVGGLAYEVQTSLSTFYQLPEVGQEVILHTHYITREDGSYLYGFNQIQERAVFRALIKITGIGPKVALIILSHVQPAQLIEYISHQDSAQLQCLPGIGKKTAERLIIEMRDRLPVIDITPTSHQTLELSIQQDAISALISLGYKPQIANQIVKKIITTSTDLNTEQIIRLALNKLN